MCYPTPAKAGELFKPNYSVDHADGVAGRDGLGGARRELDEGIGPGDAEADPRSEAPDGLVLVVDDPERVDGDGDEQHGDVAAAGPPRS